MIKYNTPYELLQERLGIDAGTIVYALRVHDYGLANDDTREEGIQHYSVTQDPNGGYPSITVTMEMIQEL